MKKTACFIALALSAASVFAGGGIGFFGSYWDIDDSDDPAIGGGVKLKTPILPRLFLEIRGSYLVDFVEGTDDESLIPVEAGLAIDFPLGEQVTLFAGGGGGYYISPEYDDVDMDDEVGYYGVAGVEIMLSEYIALFAEAKYTAVEFDGAEVEDLDIEFDDDAEMKGLGVNAGVMLLW
ncbi:MAG: outer membrane beta-barrel protein [Kiritimatiellia bacterium]